MVTAAPTLAGDHEITEPCSLLTSRLWLRPGENFLKSQVVSKRVLFQRVRKSESEIIKSKRGGHR